MNRELLDKYFAGYCTPAEIQQVEDWLGKHEALPEVDAVAPKGVKEAIWHSLRQRTNVKSGRIYPKLAAAAAALVLVFAGAYIVSMQRTKTPITWHTASNPGGRAIKITLPDNSIVQLNGGAVLEYPSAFDAQRTVKLLSGEAFFDISQDKEHPFMVKTEGEGSILVLGTSFNVKHRFNQPALEITLRTGAILFKTPAHQQVQLSPGERLEYRLDKQQAMQVTKTDTAAIGSWTNGTLRFNETPIEEVFATLESYYGIPFVIEQQPSQQSISGRFTGRSLSEILLLIEKTTDVKFRQERARIIVTK